MRIKRCPSLLHAILLTPFLVSGCSLVRDHFQESCHSHAYSQQVLTDYIATRFIPRSPVRLGIIPASAPMNMSGTDLEHPGVGSQLAIRIQQDLVNFGEVPIVEVLNRNDWPGKKEEFFTGNFGAIRMGREAGYDMVLVTFIESQNSQDELSAYAKVLDTSSGTTIYYGKITATSGRRELRDLAVPFGIMKREPSHIYLNNLVEKLGQCVSQAVMRESTTPQ